jgi:FAD/FMN-containing dehydrogenase
MNAVFAELAAQQWDGTLRTDDAARSEVADDFGHLVSRRPAAVLRAGSTADVARVVRTAAACGVPVTARGMGHSTFGQSQVSGGIVVDMRGLASIGPLAGDRITVDAGATWRAVLAAVPGHTPPVLPDYLGLTVGGTLAVGGIGGTSHRYGAQTDHVLALEVVTGDGITHTCQPDSPLGRAVLAGLGQVGIVTSATVRLIPVADTVRRYKLYYPSVPALVNDQRKLLAEGRFDHLQGEILPGEHGWQYQLDAAHYGRPRGDARLLAGLSDDRRRAEIEDVDHQDFADRMAPAEAYLRRTGEWQRPHPWWNVLLPNSTADTFLRDLVAHLTIGELGASGLVLIYPVHTKPLATPLFRTPEDPVAFLVGMLSTTDGDQREITTNREWYDHARELGGVAYQVGAIPFTEQDWQNHFGDQWDTFETAKSHHDPMRILCPGQGIFSQNG